MLLASAVVLVVLCLGLVVLAARSFRDADQALLDGERAVRRQRAWAVERRVYLDSRTRIADGVQVGTEAVAFGSALARVGHTAAARIPFGLFRAIPVTRARAERLQAAHDEKAAQMYDAIDSVSARIAEGVRRRLTGVDDSPRELRSSEQPDVLEVEFEVRDEIDPG
ncbi:hypothetical protein GCM10011584_08620 [Nocardioides phosphati]|uniref:LemA family protein n=1 Tax=Nocardioides phosphati TaxID=1867775 RepID=A0ABQ2N838_9ACTN|nr:hypothetical protein [Nocardioides phosphati]GGO86402.1 hypothetical protein GCM10011584_08620 [Nocardioides phosphati]